MCDRCITRRSFLGGATLAAVGTGISMVLSAGCAPLPSNGPLAIGVRTSNCQSPFFVADDRRIYADHGLNVDLRLVASNTEIIEALQRGDLQMGSLPITTAIAAISRNAPIHIVAMAGRGSDGILVRSDDGALDVAGLAGQRIVTIRASILDVLLRNTLEVEGIDPESDVELVYMSKLGDMISALKTGQVEASSNTEPFMTDAERQGWGRILTYYTAQWEDHPCCVVVARDDLAEQRPEALQGLLASHKAAVDWSNDHLDDTAQTVVDYLGAFDAGLVRNSLEPSKMRLDYRVDPAEVAKMAGLMESQGLIDRAPEATRLVSDRALAAMRED